MGWQETLSWPRLVLFLAIVFFFLTFAEPYARRAFQHVNVAPEKPVDKELDAWCPLPESTAPYDDGIGSFKAFAESRTLELQVERLSAAINVSTVSYSDNGGVDDDPRWRSFEQLHEVLEGLFPLVHQKLELEKVNKYGLLYTLHGSMSQLKPVVFMAHQDVVPAIELSKWTHPPFEAFWDGQWLWGRGAVDCKNNLIGLLSSMEGLLEKGFEPKRTIIFSFGFDEETGGERGARHLSAYLEEKLGKDSVAMIMDEGGMGIDTLGDITYAFPATAEKGFIDIILTVETAGGHSSRPPAHSAIGIMSELVLTLEDHAFTPVLADKNPYRNVLECQAKYSPKDVEPWLKDALKDSPDLGQRIAESRGDAARWLFQTSQAVDIIHGGEKDNQLPERVVTTINYRIAPQDDIQTLLSDTTRLLLPVAHKHSLSVIDFDIHGAPSPQGFLNLTYTDRLSPSPISPTGTTSAIWSLFASTIQQVYSNTSSSSTGQRPRLVVPVGNIMSGNTDTIHYWDLTRNIYRFSPRREGTVFGVHTTDERIDMRTHLEGMMLYEQLIRNLDRFEGE